MSMSPPEISLVSSWLPVLKYKGELDHKDKKEDNNMG